MVVLCEDCHKLEHESIEQSAQTLIGVLKFNGFISKDFMDLAVDYYEGDVLSKRLQKNTVSVPRQPLLLDDKL
jgi:hypothetical protein